MSVEQFIKEQLQSMVGISDDSIGEYVREPDKKSKNAGNLVEKLVGALYNEESTARKGRKSRKRKDSDSGDEKPTKSAKSRESDDEEAELKPAIAELAALAELINKKEQERARNAGDTHKNDGGSTSKVHSCSNNRWNPLGFFLNNWCVNGDPQQPLDPTSVQKNSEKLSRNVRETDVSYWINLAAEAKQNGDEFNVKMAAGMAFHTEQQNRLIRMLSRKSEPEKSNVNSEITLHRGFYLDDALKMDKTITLPTKKCFMLGQVITIDECSKWTSEKFDTHTRQLALSVFDKIAEVDDEFYSYSAKPKPVCYIYVGHEFFRTFANVILAGFGQKDSNNLASRVIGHVRSVFANKLTRVRVKLEETHGTKWCEQQAKKLKTVLETTERQFQWLPFQGMLKLEEPTPSLIPEDECEEYEFPDE
uniref:Uncharacterized protein n=1 Tax=Caenorhabditis japonica TaxID=281687 RepID=A0A8R1DGL9_CAEJA